MGKGIRLILFGVLIIVGVIAILVSLSGDIRFAPKAESSKVQTLTGEEKETINEARLEFSESDFLRIDVFDSIVGEAVMFGSADKIELLAEEAGYRDQLLYMACRKAKRNGNEKLLSELVKKFEDSGKMFTCENGLGYYY